MGLMRPKPAVHYAGHGTRGLAFDCFLKALDAYLKSAKGSGTRPPSTTSINRVTCNECWAKIEAMARLRQGA